MSRLVRIRRRPGIVHRSAEHGEEGQSMLEMTFGVIFLVLIVVALFEMAMLFYAYIALVNASREGAVKASLYASLAPGDPAWNDFTQAVYEEADASGLATSSEFFEIQNPVYGLCNPDNPYDTCVSVTVGYRVVAASQGLFLPLMGRMGIFDTVWAYAHTIMPVRYHPYE